MSTSPLVFNVKPHYIALRIAEALDKIQPGCGRYYLGGFFKRRSIEIEAAFPAKRPTTEDTDAQRKQKKGNE